MNPSLILLLILGVSSMTLEQHQQHRQGYFKQKKFYSSPNYHIKEVRQGVYECNYKHDTVISRFLNKRVVIELEQETSQVLQISIYPVNTTYSFRIPEGGPFGQRHFRKPNHDQTPLWNAKIVNGSSLRIWRRETNETIFHLQDMVHTRFNKELTYDMPSHRVMGMGERNGPLLLEEDSIYTLFARDSLKDIETGRPPGHNTYSSMPIYLAQEYSRHSHLVYIRNSNPMDFVLGKGQAQIRSLGQGEIDIKIFMTDRHKHIGRLVRDFHAYLGKYYLPPFWAFGFHQSKWGLDSSDQAEQIIQKYNAHQLPLDSYFFDIDLLHNKQSFTFAPQFSPFHLASLRKRFQKRLIVIVDVGIGAENLNDPILESALEHNICLRFSADQYLVGKVWPGKSLFPDFTHPNATLFYQVVMKPYLSIFDGFWLDMNEISNFCDGLCPDMSLKKDDPYIDKVIYYPGRRDLQTGTLPMDTLHYSGALQMEMHNLNGHLHVYTFHSAIKDMKPKNKNLLITRSAFPGTGQWAGKWSGDNASNFVFLRLSIAHLLQFNLFGMPFTGSDICGFYGDTTPELCARWIQLGSWYPFARNHNHNNQLPQELYALGEMVLNTAREALRFRYSLLRHLFSLFILRSCKGMVAQPVYFQFPEDDQLYHPEVADTHFMLGIDLLIAPHLQAHSSFTQVYLPQGKWFSLRDHLTYQGGFLRPIPAPLHSITNVFLRQGRSLFQQPTQGVLSSDDLDNSYSLVVGLSSSPSLEITPPGSPSPLHLPPLSRIQSFYSRGSVVGLSHFSDSLVQRLCENNKYKCLLVFSIHVAVLDSTAVQMQLDFRHQLDYVKVKPQDKEVHIEQLQLFGLPPLTRGEWVFSCQDLSTGLILSLQAQLLPQEDGSGVMHLQIQPDTLLIQTSSSLTCLSLP